MAGNHKPIVRGDDDGIWRRMRLVPFTNTIPEAQRDKRLAEKLRAEASGILNWALVGCRSWRRNGLATPKVVTDAVEAYKQEMDILGEWIAECCNVGQTLSVPAWQAYASYSDWAKRNGFPRPWTSKKFGQKVKERYGSHRTAAGIVYDGLEVKPLF